MILFNKKSFVASDKMKITYYQTPDSPKTLGMVLIVHGMAEHALRYREFADFLSSQNFMVFAHDQRGHGQTGTDARSLGFFSESNGWQRVVDDVYEFATLIKKENPDLPLFILGHSMGSVVTRSSIIQFPELFKSGVVVGTTVGINKFMRKVGGFIANHEIKKAGAKTPSQKLSNLSFGSYNKKFAPNRTAYDWLSLFPENVDAYIADPLCGFTCSAGFYKDLFYGIDFASNKKNIQKIPLDFPILFLAGSDDPVGGMGKEVKLVHRLSKNAGLKEVELKLYSHLRHEILNEENRKMIYYDIKNFLMHCL